MSGTRKLAAILVSDVGLEPTCQEGLAALPGKAFGNYFPVFMAQAPQRDFLSRRHMNILMVMTKDREG
jgi:hypothetical protein